MQDELQHLSDFDLCHQCVEGDAAAIRMLRARSSSFTKAYLLKTGGNVSEVEDVVERLWADLLTPPEGGLPSISRYNGRSSFQTWFNVIALNKLITKKRKEARWSDLIPKRIDEGAGADQTLPNQSLVDSSADEPDSAVLIDLMRDAIEHAFTHCPPEDFVLLQLKHCDGLHGTELAVMFGCHPSAITRRIEKAEGHIAAETTWKIRQKDPWLELRYQDFVELCGAATPACFGLG